MSWAEVTAKLANAPRPDYRPVGRITLTERQVSRLRRLARTAHELEQQNIALGQQYEHLFVYRQRLQADRQQHERTAHSLRAVMAGMRNPEASAEAAQLKATEAKLAGIDARAAETEAERQKIDQRRKSISAVLAPRNELVRRLIGAGGLSRGELGIDWGTGTRRVSEVITA